MKQIMTIILMSLVFTGCIDNPLQSKSERAINTLEGELTKYTKSISIGNKDMKTYLQNKYPNIYVDDSVEILSFGFEPYVNKVFIILKKDSMKIKLTTPCIGLSCDADKSDVILFTENKEKIKDAIKRHVSKSYEVEAISLKKHKDINCSKYNNKL